MPTSKLINTPTPSNALIGGVPTIHYLDFLSRGRGQVVRLFFEDAGIAYNDVRYSSAEWPAAKKSVFIEGGLNPTGNLPVIELGGEGGEVLTQSYPTLRYLAGMLGRYDGVDAGERYWVDRVCDVAIDWRTLFIMSSPFSEDKEKYLKHCATDRPRLANAIETHLKRGKYSQGGPFVLGDRITYVDFVVYQILHDEGMTKDERKGMENLPRLRSLVEGVEEREAVRAFLESERYLG